MTHLSVQRHIRELGARVVRDVEPASFAGIEPDPALERREAWTVVAGLNTELEIGLDIGDAGALHVLVPTQDLRRR